MPEYMCLTTCLMTKKGPSGKPYQELITQGETLKASQAPNKHFIEIEGDLKGATLEEILIQKLSMYDDIYVDDTMTVHQLQAMLAERRLEEAQKPDVDLMKEVLDASGIEYHHRLGAVRLNKLIVQHGLEDELKEARKTKEE